MRSSLAAGCPGVAAEYVTGSCVLEESMHHVRVDVAERGVIERSWQRRENREPQLLPEMNRALVRAHHEVELHRPIPGTPRLVQAMLAHGAADAAAAP